MANRPEFDEDIDILFTVWADAYALHPDRKSEDSGRKLSATTARAAAERCAMYDWAEAPSNRQQNWPCTYTVRDGASGQIWTVTVDIVMQPTFVSIDANEVEMQPATHVVWGDKVMCEDLRFSRPDWHADKPSGRWPIPRAEWPAGQRSISLDEVRDGAVPEDPCELCWSRATKTVADILKLMKESR